MLSSQKLEVFFDLQQILLNTEDSNLLLEKLFPQILNRMDSAGLDCQFIGACFLNQDNQIQKNYFVDKNEEHSITQTPLNWQVVLQNLKDWEKELLWGPVVLSRSKNAQILSSLLSSYPDYKIIESVEVLPILISHRLAGIMMFGESRSIDQDYIEFFELMANLISLAYRLEDTQISLGNISQEVYKMNAKLHQLDRLKDEFVSVASHELRTPMTAIKSYAWMALHRPDIPLTEKMKKYLSRTLLSTERLINLVNDMLNVSRIESGRIEISPKAFDIVSLVKDVVDEVNPRASEQGLNLSIVDTQIPKVFADPDKIHEVLLNLVGNALKFTPSGGNIAISFFSDGQVVETSVKDSGSGIARDDLSRLFQKFGRLDNSYVSMGTSGGTGLGLYISKNLIELMHGKIWAQSEGLGKGATFSFSLPVASQELLAQAEKYHIKPEGEAKELEPVAI